LYAEGKDLPLAVGIMVMTTEEIQAASKGFAIEQTHFLDDALWKADELE
jgi:predicted RNA-binding protein (TIGR00451 family)